MDVDAFFESMRLSLRCLSDFYALTIYYNTGDVGIIGSRYGLL